MIRAFSKLYHLICLVKLLTEQFDNFIICQVTLLIGHSENVIICLVTLLIGLGISILGTLLSGDAFDRAYTKLYHALKTNLS